MLELEPVKNTCSKSFCLIKDLIVVKSIQLHVLSDIKSLELQELKYYTPEGEMFLQFHVIQPTFMYKIVENHHNLLFPGYMGNRLSVLINAAILWAEWYDKMDQIEAYRNSFLGSKDVTDFARVIYQPLVNVQEISFPDYVKFDQALVINGILENDAFTHMLLIRRFKRFFDSKLVKKDHVTNQLYVCTYATSSKHMIQLTKYYSDSIQINSDMDFNRQAYLFSMCDILITQDPMDFAIIFLLKRTVKILGINLDEKWAKKISSFWNIKVFTEKINLSSGNHLAILSNFVNILKYSDKTRYLMFMPWEQLNNQLIGFKAACAMAHILDRILVLPYLGYRTNNYWDFSFNHKDYAWSPMEKYFDLVDLPCQTISLSSFKTIYGRNIGSVHFNPVAKATSHMQLTDYYKDVLGLYFTSIINHDKMSQLSDKTVLEMFDQDASKVLSFGSLFWAYGFNKTQEYPLKTYVSYMDNPLYREITKGMRIKNRIASFSRKSIKKRIADKSLISVHIRRGDYWNKCRAISDLVLQSHCYPSIRNISQQITLAIQSLDLEGPTNSQNAAYSSDWGKASYYLYISTNLNGDRSELDQLMREFNTLFFEDIYEMAEIERLRLDPIHTALMDRSLGINSDIFIGNFYSSFSRTIFEGRELLNRTFKFF